MTSPAEPPNLVVVKLKPNQPCPCGSGRKYKRCCGSLADRSNSAVVTGRASVDESEHLVPSTRTLGKLHSAGSEQPAGPRWNPIPLSLMPRRLTDAQSAVLVQRTNPRVITLIGELSQTMATDQATELLSILEQASDLELSRNRALLDARSTALHVLERSPEALELQYRHLIVDEDRSRWAQRGRAIQDLIMQHPERREAVAADLRNVCRTLASPVPRLLLAFLLMLQQRERGAPLDPDELRELWTPAIRPSSWTREQAYVHRWIKHIASGLSGMVPMLIGHDERREAANAAQAALAFPWERGALSEIKFSRFARLYFGLDLDAALSELCKRMLRANPSWGAPHHWLGWIAALNGKRASAVQHLRASIPGRVEEIPRLGACETLINIGEPALALDILATLPPSSTNEADMLKGRALLDLDRNEEALALYQAMREGDPDNLGVRVQIGVALSKLQRTHEAEAELLACIGDDLSPTTAAARTPLLVLLRVNGKIEEAVEMHQWFLQPERAPLFLSDDFRAKFAASYGETLAAAGRLEEAVEQYREAIELEPTERIVHGYAAGLLELNRIPEADEALRTCGLLETSPELRFLKLFVDERLQRWEIVLGGVASMEDWLRENNHVEDIIVYRLRAYVMTYRPLDAVAACEADLAMILADPKLSKMRSIALRAAQQQMKSLQDWAGEQNERFSASQEQSRRQMAEVKRRSLHLVTEIRRLEKDRESLRALQQTPKAASFMREREQLPEELRGKLPPDVIALLATAEAAWNHLAADADHAPVIVQHARALESVLLRSVCRPLLSLARERGVDVEPRQATKLSLGEAAILLAGDTPAALRCASGPLWHDALEAFWSTGARAVCSAEERGWLRRTAPPLVQSIAKMRNEAAHGATLIPRTAAGKVRSLVLGEDMAQGMLVRIHAMSMALVHA